LYPGAGGLRTKPKEWSKKLEDKVIDLSQDLPMRTDVTITDENIVPLAYTMPVAYDDSAKEDVRWKESTRD
jgi:hypothetical protein